MIHRTIKHTLVFLLVSLLWGCSKESLLGIDVFKNTLDNTIPVADTSLKKLEGHYFTSDKNNFFGNQFICLVNKKTITLISNKGGLYLVCDAGYSSQDSTFLMRGYYRDPLSSAQGFVKLSFKNNIGNKNILTQGLDSTLTFQVFYQSNENDLVRTFSLKYTRPFKENALHPTYHIVAHRGGGRNSDDLPYSENSIEMIKHASDFGANGIEIDIKLTADLVPVIYHDDDINTRLTLKSPIIGDIGKYRYKTLESFVRLIKGEKIPTLEETLDFVVDSTNLNFVWLDIKDATNMFEKIVPIVTKAQSDAVKKNREIKIYFGIPTEEVYQSFIQYPNYQSLPALCEIDLDHVNQASAEVWAPRWTLGLDKNSIQGAQQNNLSVITWTLDDETLIKRYIATYNYDGILTNYPSLVASSYYQLYR